MLYALTAHLTFVTDRELSDGSTFRKLHGERRQLLAVGSHEMLLAEDRRWKKVASLWANEVIKSFPHGTFGKPQLRLVMEEVAV